jgi:hypothetical protein
MDEKFRKSLQGRFTKRGAYDVFQPGLIKSLNEAIGDTIL